jgi:MinD-like ATPase involved in chromosome partitioning or flagellar assembly/DNA-binding response OmpR family regulator
MNCPYLRDRQKVVVVGWVEQSETQHTQPITCECVGLMRSARLRQHIRSTQPTTLSTLNSQLSTPMTTQVQHTLQAYLRHELCTPINATIGYSALLLEELRHQPDTTIFSDLQKIHNCSQELLTLVTTILDPVQLELSQIEGDLGRFGAELRRALLTPLSTIIGYCEMLLEEAPAELIGDLDKIHASAQQLLGMVNDIINLAQQQLQTLTAPDLQPPQLLFEHPATATLVQSATTTIDTLSQPSFEPPVPGGLILVVDDNPTNCDLLSRQLERQGHTVSTATNAAQALRLLKAVAFDLILLDVIMPGVNGLELLQQIEQNDKLKHIPTIAISALDSIDSAVKCLELGAEDYLHKPCNPILLKARIAACLEKKRLRDQEILYLQQVERLMAAAAAIETKTFNPDSLNDLSQHPHKLGQLARVFQQMAKEVDAREQQLVQQVQRLQVSIDQGQKQRLVAEVAATDHFQQLQKRTKRSSDIENLYRSSLYPSLHPAPPQSDRSLPDRVEQSPLLVAKKVQQPANHLNVNVGNSKIVAVHSFRGGTGKSNLTSNLAVSLAKQGKRVAIVDTDLQSPGIHVLFGLEDETIDLTLNDYLWERCSLYEAAYDLKHILPSNTVDGALYLIPASVKANDINRILQEGYHQERLLDGFAEIVRDLQLDFLLIDTHPGINEETLQAISICSLLVVVMRPDYQDYQGTAAIVELGKLLSVQEMLLVVNKALPSFDIEGYRQQLETAYDVPVAAILPFTEAMMSLASSEVFALRYPAHPLSQAVDLICDRLITPIEIPSPR